MATMLLRDRVLAVLEKEGRLPARDVAAALGVNRKLVMRILTDLEREGLVAAVPVRELRWMRLRHLVVQRRCVRHYRLVPEAERLAMAADRAEAAAVWGGKWV